MESNVKKELVKSIQSIKSKVKQMRDEEAELDLKGKKLFKPMIDPLNHLVLVEKNKCLKTNKKTLNSTIEDKNFANSTIQDYSSDSYTSFSNNKDDDSSTETDVHIELPKLRKLENVKSPMKLEPAVAKVPTTPSGTASRENPFYRSKNLQVPFGIRSEDDRLLIGNTPVLFQSAPSSNSQNKKTIAKIGVNAYEITPGLKELLFESKPNLAAVSESDKLIYKDILCNTNAHRRDYKPSGQLKGDKGAKYCTVIKPMFSDAESQSVKRGGRLPIFKTYKKNTDLVYWDDPNELIDRLKILIASKNAGNTNHDNEIISIIEELQEAGIIIA